MLHALFLMLSIKVATNILMPEEMGKYYIIASVVNFFGLIFISPVGQYINRMLNSWVERGNLLSVFKRFNYYIIIISLLSAPMVYFSKEYFGLFKEISGKKLILVSMLGIYINSWFGTIVPTINMIGYRVYFTLLSVFSVFLGLLFSYYIVVYYEAAGFSWYVGQFLIAQLLVLVLSFYVLKNRLIRVENLNAEGGEGIRDVIEYSSPLVLATVFMWMLNDSYRFIVEKYTGVIELGNVAIGIGLASSILGVLEAIFQQTFYPIFYKKINTTILRERENACENLINFALPVFLVICMFLSFSSPFVSLILTSKNYQGSVIYIIYGAWIGFFRFAINTLSAVAHSEFRTRNLIKPYFISGVFNVLLMLVFVGYFKNSSSVGLILIVSHILGLVVLKNELNQFINVEINYPLIVRTVLISLPFSGMMLFDTEIGILKSLLLLILFGLYLGGVLAYLVKRCGVIKNS